MVAAYLRAILRAESDAAITYSVLDNFKWWKCHVLIDRIMASIVPIMSTKLAIPYRVIYMLPIHISIHIDNVALVWSQHQTCLSGGVIISAVFLICCCYLFSSFLSWGNCMGSCSWPIIVSSNFVTPHPTFSRPHYVKLYEAEKTWGEVWQVHKTWVESGHAPKGVVFCLPLPLCA